ncbi:uncharacterized protein BDZ83DRAFT_658551 [Colletotrichum acutatum]|uniref:Uncharacterized protein n=1 Tax=Glomerella acutata TaxID=27357 RepID=A0AAD8U672_GLOAC|nr:uncharacterized protein BDZ83DRAFT_658551 [Colletotrichum acutatum]KAK1701924.1 hypothetical protein BDZ83DRAFT_658551 [Colletotrichum acutatum]
MFAQSLHAVFPALKGPVNLPYEIFLLIVEAMISEAYARARQEKVIYKIDFTNGRYQSVPQSSFSVVLESRKGVKIQMQRWKQIRDLLRVDGTSRCLVGRVFVTNDMIWPQTLTPETLLCFPNLQEIWVQVEQKFTGIDPRVSFHDSHDDDMPLDTQILPELGLDASGHDMKTLKTQLRVAEKRGINVHVTTGRAWTQSSRAKTLRLFLKDGAVRMQLVDPHCDCYLELAEDLRALGLTLEQAMQQDQCFTRLGLWYLRYLGCHGGAFEEHALQFHFQRLFVSLAVDCSLHRVLDLFSYHKLTVDAVSQRLLATSIVTRP